MPRWAATESIWAATRSASTAAEAVTAVSDWAVTAVRALAPCTPRAANVARSACTPAPPSGSEAAIVSSTGGMVDTTTLDRAT